RHRATRLPGSPPRGLERACPPREVIEQRSGARSILLGIDSADVLDEPRVGYVDRPARGNHVELDSNEPKLLNPSRASCATPAHERHGLASPGEVGVVQCVLQNGGGAAVVFGGGDAETARFPDAS